MQLKSSLKNVAYGVSRMMMPRSGAVILAYHSIGTNGRPFTVSPEAFERQMQWLKGSGCNIISLDELTRYRAAGQIPPGTVAITFDDGYEDNCTNAFPVLQRYRIPATIFVTTGDLTGKKIALRPLAKMNDAQLRLLHESGLVAIEPHSDTHPTFTDISEEEIEREVRESKAYLEFLLKKNCIHFAYPRGHHSDAAHRVLARCGISFGYGFGRGRVQPLDNPYALKRNGIAADTSFAEFKGIASFGRLAAPAVFSGWSQQN
jgi:peptidoglycan/xylan/chitin deacetylase (PgdA/CDA1 family)